MTEDRPIRVTLLAPRPPPIGGVSRWADHFLAAAPAHGLDMSVVDVSPRQADMTENSRFRLQRATQAFEILADLRRDVARRKPDLVHVTTNLRWATFRDAGAIELARQMGVPGVLNIHGSNQMITWRDALPLPARMAFDGALRRAAAVVVLSVELETYLRHAVPQARIVRIPNMVQAAVAPTEKVLPPPGNRLRVLFVGWQMPGKGLSELAQALLPLPDLELITIGGRAVAAGERQALEMQGHLQALAQQGRWIDLGELLPEQVLAAYHEVDVFALPTYQEGMPNVLLEAMAAGLPCVVTPVGAIPELAGDDRALQVPPRQVPPLTEALDRLARDPPLRRQMGQRARTYVEQSHGTDAILRQFRDLYLGLVRDRRDRP